jgi:hypothetical protein
MTEVVNESHLKLRDEEEVLQAFCCVHCQKYANCVTKWTRQEKGEEQLCCEACAKYGACH